MNKHTPGPWTIGPIMEEKMKSGLIRRTVPVYQSNHKQPEWSDGHPHPIIAEMHWHPDEAEANARLIAAAPEMLEALENALSQFNPRECNCDGESTQDGMRGHACYFHRIADEIKRAIAKAIGAE